jgi:hypothetical protein
VVSSQVTNIEESGDETLSSRRRGGEQYEEEWKRVW